MPKQQAAPAPPLKLLKETFAPSAGRFPHPPTNLWPHLGTRASWSGPWRPTAGRPAGCGCHLAASQAAAKPPSAPSPRGPLGEPPGSQRSCACPSRCEAWGRSAAARPPAPTCPGCRGVRPRPCHCCRRHLLWYRWPAAGPLAPPPTAARSCPARHWPAAAGHLQQGAGKVHRAGLRSGVDLTSGSSTAN